MTEEVPDEINPMVRIATALEYMAKTLEKMANPPLTCRASETTLEFHEPGAVSYFKD